MNGIITLYLFSAVFALMVFITWIFERHDRKRERMRAQARAKAREAEALSRCGKDEAA